MPRPKGFGYGEIAAQPPPTKWRDHAKSPNPRKSPPKGLIQHALFFVEEPDLNPFFVPNAWKPQAKPKGTRLIRGPLPIGKLKLSQLTFKIFIENDLQTNMP